MFEKVLVALDNSSEASAVFDFALSIVRPKTGELLLLHFVDWQMKDVPLWIASDSSYDINSTDRYDWSHQCLQQEVETSKNWLETFSKKAEKLNLTCKSECQLGNCNLGIGDRAKEWGADLIVIGRRDRRNISEIFLGSVSNYVINHAPCSVLVVQGSKNLKIEELADLAEVQP